MAASIHEFLQTFAGFSAHERREAVVGILRLVNPSELPSTGIDDAEVFEPLSTSQDEEIQRRIAYLDEHPESATAWDEFKSELKASPFTPSSTDHKTLRNGFPGSSDHNFKPSFETRERLRDE